MIFLFKHKINLLCHHDEKKREKCFFELLLKPNVNTVSIIFLENIIPLIFKVTVMIARHVYFISDDY